jgi:hypothetical protein
VHVFWVGRPIRRSSAISVEPGQIDRVTIDSMRSVMILWLSNSKPQPSVIYGLSDPILKEKLKNLTSSHIPSTVGISLIVRGYL